MAIKLGAIFAVFLSVTAVSGCSVNLTKSVDDYTGTDFSRIRVKNYLPPLTFEVYEKSGQCYKLVDAKSLTAGVNIIGIKSTYNKKTAGHAAAIFRDAGEGCHRV